ncbi:DEAD/DEAH box helicase family protein [Brevundimonas sp.]|uniref:DEAD/DEAH box helicase family protein n=1 Tax=Brevundimonas sp. TaxID=1871086 RepID=UPI0028A0B320|nr:DEAD/DEAH box helicase family protein [Brevundimonas sp.]
MAKMKVTMLTGPQGSGKSTVMREEAIARPGLYLFAAPTHELIDEQANDFRRDARWLKTWPVHSKVGGKGKVEERLEHARSEIMREGHKHAVILTTHDAMMGSDLSLFAGWHARIDEAPAAIQAGSFNVSEMRTALKDRFALHTKPGHEWASLRLRGDKPSWKRLQGTLGAKELVEFYKQAANTARVFVSTPDWDATDDIEWFSMWTPLELAGFASVQIAGSSYTRSVGYLAAKAIYEDRLEFDEREILVARTGQPSICIHYFTEGHRGSTTFWETSDGRLQIKHVCDYLGKTLPKASFWSGNTVVQHLMEHRIKGALIKASAAGLNKHRNRQHCAIIFSGKATKADKGMMAAFGLDKDDIERAREDELIRQFVMRGAIRNPIFDGAYDVYVYEKVQAERLKSHFGELGFDSVELVPLADAGLMTVRRKSDGPSDQEKAAKKAERNEKAAKRGRKKRKAEAEAAGREVGQPGNPKLKKTKPA